jgi:hypothetical protein
MIARARTEIGLRVTFHRDDVMIDSAVVPTGEDARDEALLIISRQDALQPGDPAGRRRRDRTSRPAAQPRQPAVKQFMLMIAADFLALAIVAGVLLLAVAAWQFVTGCFL